MKNILVVDDESFITRVVSHGLQRRGYQVLVADSGERALELAAQHPLELVITDYQLPAMNGVGFVRQLLLHPKHKSVPVIMLSGREFEIPPDEFTNTNIKLVVGKPFSMKSIAREV